MTLKIALSSKSLHGLDLSPVEEVIQPLLQAGTLTSYQHKIQFNIDYPREADDPRELSEIAPVRLWFIRLDTRYPWLPILLDWKAGELARYAAMLVPHQFSRKEGIQYNPEALEIFVMNKIFVITDWMKSQGADSKSSLQSMAQMFGYELDEEFFNLIR